MKIKWTVKEHKTKTLKAFLKEKNISKRILAKIKFQGGSLEINNVTSRVRDKVEYNDIVSMTLPKEAANDSIQSSDLKIDILYEDEHFLFVNKPAGIASVPSSLYPKDTMANRVKGYTERHGYIHKTIHVVSRLDKDTSGVMLFAKHALAHSFLDTLLQDKEVYKEYLALVNGRIKHDHDVLAYSISRADGSIIEREVNKNGKPSLTEFWVKKRFENATELTIQLHTGRTHQIRVHFAHINHPLIGDTLYGELEAELIKRQALHCSVIQFTHPFTHEEINIKAPLPEDIKLLKQQLRRI